MCTEDQWNVLCDLCSFKLEATSFLVLVGRHSVEAVLKGCGLVQNHSTIPIKIPLSVLKFPFPWYLPATQIRADIDQFMEDPTLVVAQTRAGIDQFMEDPTLVVAQTRADIDQFMEDPTPVGAVPIRKTKTLDSKLDSPQSLHSKHRGEAVSLGQRSLPTGTSSFSFPVQAGLFRRFARKKTGEETNSPRTESRRARSSMEKSPNIKNTQTEVSEPFVLSVDILGKANSIPEDVQFFPLKCTAAPGSKVYFEGPDQEGSMMTLCDPTLEGKADKSKACGWSVSTYPRLLEAEEKRLGEPTSSFAPRQLLLIMLVAQEIQTVTASLCGSMKMASSSAYVMVADGAKRQWRLPAL